MRSGDRRRAGAVAAILLLVLLVPLSGPRGRAADAGRRVIVITPHNEQIRYEFGRAFSAWHARRFGEPAEVVWSVPGGTGDIRRLLEAQYAGALAAGEPLGGSADLVFGGGSAEHARLARPLEVTVEGRVLATTITVPAGFDAGELEALYGPNRIGGAPLYDERLHWLGTALSSFGIVYNRDALAEAGAAPPAAWDDLAAPALLGWVSLANPGQSGSIASTFETILQASGWTEGWRILRRAGANARAFPASSLGAVADVSRGDSAAGMCIDFLGRFQAQAIADAGDPGRLGYVDPAEAAAFDPDPVSMLRGAPNARLARRFIEFCLTEEGQCLWQLPAGAPGGPQRYELRRLPILRSVYERHLDRFRDRIDPFELARPAAAETADRGRITALFAAMAIDNRDLLRESWRAIVSHSAYPAGGAVVTADDVADPTLRRMLELFDEMPAPDAAGEDGEAGPRRRWREFFEERYERILHLAASSRNAAQLPSSMHVTGTGTVCAFGIEAAEARRRLARTGDRGARVVVEERGSIVTARIEAEERARLDQLARIVLRHLSPWAFGRDGATLSAAAGELLSAAGLRLATAESCTGGLLGAMIVDTAGCSAYYAGGFVTYSDTLKESCLGVEGALLARHGAVSGPVAAAMARGALERTGAGVSLAITGVAGPDGSAAKPPGTVFVAVGRQRGDGVEARVRRFAFPGDRGAVRDLSARSALQLLRFELQDVPEDVGLRWQTGDG